MGSTSGPRGRRHRPCPTRGQAQAEATAATGGAARGRLGGRQLVLVPTVRRLFCDQPASPRRGVAEQIPAPPVSAAHPWLTEMLEHIAAALAALASCAPGRGAAGDHLASWLRAPWRGGYLPRPLRRLRRRCQPRCACDGPGCRPLSPLTAPGQGDQAVRRPDVRPGERAGPAETGACRAVTQELRQSAGRCW